MVPPIHGVAAVASTTFARIPIIGIALVALVFLAHRPLSDLAFAEITSPQP